MDDKKNVGFVPGLALILAALALLLIGITQISSTPYSDTLEKVINTKMQALETRLIVKIDNNLEKLSKAEEDAALRGVKVFKANLESWLAGGANGNADQVKIIQVELEKLIAGMEGIPAEKK